MKTSQVGLKPIEKTNDILVLTRSKACGPFSFINSQRFEYQDIRPPPVYLSLADLNIKKSYEMADIEVDFKIEKNGILKLINEELRERQKGVISDVLKKFAMLIAERKSLIYLSLPIRIFEPRSLLDRLCDVFHFFPHYMSIAVNNTSIVERIKYILIALFAMLTHILSQWKPFNPLLGETFQAFLGPDTTISLEQISHHPPTSGLYIFNNKYKIYGQLTLNAKVSANKLKTLNEGFLTAEFFDGMKIKFHIPVAQISGTVIGQRTFQFVHSFVAFEETSCTKGAITFSDGKQGKNFFTSMFSKGGRIDDVHGSIYKYNKDIHEKIISNGDWYNVVKAGDTKSDKIEEICQITGSLWTNLSFDLEEYYDYEKDHNKYFQHMVNDDPLPSDSRFREDLIWLFYQNQKFAQEWKLAVEDQQRYDRDLRANSKTKK